MLIALSLISTFALAEPQTVSNDLHDAVQTTSEVAHTVSVAADAVANTMPQSEHQQASTKEVVVPVAEPHTKNPDVNPTLQYLLEEFKGALSTGLPLASEGVKSICFQIQMMGAGFVVFNLFKIGVGFLLMLFAKKMWVYGARVNSTRRGGDEQPMPQIGAIVMGMIGVGIVLFTFDDFGEAIMMAGAPVVWAIKNIFGV